MLKILKHVHLPYRPTRPVQLLPHGKYISHRILQSFVSQPQVITDDLVTITLRVASLEYLYLLSTRITQLSSHLSHAAGFVHQFQLFLRIQNRRDHLVLLHHLNWSCNPTQTMEAQVWGRVHCWMSNEQTILICRWQSHSLYKNKKEHLC